MLTQPTNRDLLLPLSESARWLMLATGAAIAFMAAPGRPSADDATLSSASHIPNLSELHVPEAMGHISEVRSPAEAPSEGVDSAPSVVLIQDAHVNYTAQKHIADILELLMREYAFRLVLVEGGEGDVSLSDMRRLGSADIRKQVAERYLRQGIIAGHEYLSLVADEPVVLWGIDDEKLYRENYAAFMAVDRLHDELSPALDRLQALVEAVGTEQISTPVKEFRAKSEAFAQGVLSLTDYARAIGFAADDHGAELSKYPHLDRFVKSEAAGRSFDPAKISEEQRAIVAKLRERAGPEEMSALAKLAKGAREGGTLEPFYLELRRLAEMHGMALSAAPLLWRYVDAMQMRSEIQAKTLWQELDPAREAVEQRMCLAEKERVLLSMADSVSLYRRLLKLKWVPRDYRRFLARRDEFLIQTWWPALEGAAREQGIDSALSGSVADLDRKLDEAVAFYRTAELRNDAMAERVLRKMKAEGVSAAALVIGGFHSDAVVDRLVAQGVRVVVITPGVGDDGSDNQKYHDLMRTQSRPWVPATELERKLGTSHGSRSIRSGP